MAQQGITQQTITDGTHHATDVSVYSSWNSTTEGGVAVLSTDLVDASNDTDAVILSPAIPGIMANNRKISVAFNTVTAGADVASDIGIMGSMDGKNWVLAVAELSADTTPNTTGVTRIEADLTDIYYGWYRLTWNDGALDTTTWQGTFHVSGLATANVEMLGVGGVGPDPS
jgi:hypothetical protein